MRRFLQYSLLFFCLVFPPSISAQTNYTIEFLNQEELASFGSVNDLYQDSTGIIWLGHFGKGLSIYNGRDIRRFYLENEGDFADRSTVFTEAGGFLYLNYGQVVKRFDPIRQVIIDSISFSSNSTDFPSISSLAVDESSGEIWAIQILEKEVTPFEGFNTIFHVWHSDGHHPFRKVSAEPLRTQGEPFVKLYGGNGFLKSGKGLIELDTSGAVKRELMLNGIDLQELTARNTVLDPEGHFLYTQFRSFSLPLELYQLDLATGQISFVEDFDMVERTSGQRLVPLPLDVLNLQGDYLFINCEHQYNRKTGEDIHFLDVVDNFIDYPLLEVKDVIIDQTGVIFAGSKFGLSKLMAQPPVFQLLPRITIRGFVEDENGVIYGSNPFPVYGEGVGISAYFPEKDSVSWIPTPFIPNWYAAIYRDQRIYFGNREFDMRTNSFRNFKDPEDKKWHPYTILQLLVNDQIWSIRWGANAIEVYDLPGLELVKIIPIPPLEDVEVDHNEIYLRPSDNTIWLGTFGKGIFVFSDTGDLLHHLNSGQASVVQLKSNTVSAFYEDAKGNMWIGQVSGISKISADLQSIEHFVLNRENPDHYIVYGLLPGEDESRLWLSTNRGIFCFDAQEGTFLDFPLNPYVMNAEYNRTSFHRSRTGRLYFSGTYERNHTVAFFPDEVLDFYEKEAPAKAPIILTQYDRYDGSEEQLFTQTRALSLFDKIVLQPGDRYFSLEFLLTDFRSPENIYYSYYLDGYETDWNTPARGNNQLKYENLPPGNYTLKLRASLTPGTMEMNERYISVRVLPPWYQTWWAWGLFVIALIGSFLYFLRRALIRQLEVQENRRLRELDQFKTRLYTNITHEFRTPLTIILGMTEQMEGEEVRRNLIQRNARSLLRLINQLLDLSKLDSGRLRLEYTRGDIVRFLKYLCDSFHYLASEKQLGLQTAFKDSSLIMEFDEEKIRHIIFNLLSNAIKFTSPGGTVSLHQETVIREGKSWLKLEVSDTGSGIKEEDLPHIFERFYQPKGQQIGGTGIGLALTKELTELMYGSISVESIPGNGTTFTLQLPVENRETIPIKAFRAESPAVEEPVPVVDQTGAESISEKPRLLIVEDNPGIVNYLLSILDQEYQLSVALDGQEGIDQAIEEIPDLILTDVMMPRKDGFQLCETLKGDPRTSHIPIVMLTARGDIDSKLAGLETGADAYLPKPFEKKELFVRLRKLLELRETLQKKYASYAVVGRADDPTLPGQAAPSLEEQFLLKLTGIIESRLSDAEITIPEISRLLAMSHTQLYRKLKAITGKTPSRFIRSVRLQKAKLLLQSTELSVSEVAYEVGFTGPQYFSTMFKEEFGYPPSAIPEK